VFSEAIDCYLQALALHREDGNRFDEAQTWESISEVHLADGSAENAIAAMRSGLAILQDIDPVAAERIRQRIQQLDSGAVIPATHVHCGR
jgi:hypothetical protein